MKHDDKTFAPSIRVDPPPPTDLPHAVRRIGQLEAQNAVMRSLLRDIRDFGYQEPNDVVARELIKSIDRALVEVEPVR